MKKCILIIVLFSLISACNKNNQDDGISAYKNKDYITAFALSEKGCREKNGEACYILANIYYMGLSHHIYHVKAARYYIISCEIGNGRACYMMGKLYSESRIIPEDIDQSEAYYRKSNKITILPTGRNSIQEKYRYRRWNSMEARWVFFYNRIQDRILLS